MTTARVRDDGARLSWTFSQEDVDVLMLSVTPLAIEIASEVIHPFLGISLRGGTEVHIHPFHLSLRNLSRQALVRWGIEPDLEGNAFIEVMNALAKLAPTDEFLAYDVYVLKQKFLPHPPASLKANSRGRRASSVRTHEAASPSRNSDNGTVGSELTIDDRSHRGSRKNAS